MTHPASDPPEFDDDLIDELCRVSRLAGTAIMAFYGSGPAVRLKPDASPVTAADEAAEAIILPALEALMPGVPIVSEEAASHGHLPDIGAAGHNRRFWLVDPLDGTREFLGGNGEFTVNIALVENTRPVLGVVHVPPSGVTYVGAGPGRATRQEAGHAATPITARRPPPDGAIVLASRSHGSGDALDAFLAEQHIAGRIRAGSSLKFCLIAEGIADLYPRFGRTMEWDTAAAHAVLASAGGSVATLDGSELGYGKPGLENPHFVARGLRHDDRP